MILAAFFALTLVGPATALDLDTARLVDLTHRFDTHRRCYPDVVIPWATV